MIPTSIAAGSVHSLAIANNDLYAWGSNASGQLTGTGGNSYTPAKIQAERDVVAIGAGYYHSVALH